MMPTEPLGATISEFFRKYYWILIRIISVVVYYIIGAIFYHISEDWTVIDSIYFVTVSVSTVGYGDFAPTTDHGMLFTSFFLVAGLIFVLSAVDEVARFMVIRAQNDLLAKWVPDSTPLERAVRKLYMSFCALTLLAITGVAFFTENEGWSAVEAFYYTLCTMTTVGYGDLRPERSSSRLFSIFFIACCMLVYFTTAHNAREYYKLTDRETNAMHSWEDSSQDDIEGGIELNPIRNESFDSLGSKENMLPAASRGQLGFAALRNFDPLESELDLVSPSKLASAASLAGDEVPISAREERRNSSSSGMSPRQRTAGSLLGTRSFPGLDAGTEITEHERVDATLHLLDALEALQQEIRSPLAAELAALRKKYVLMTPQDLQLHLTRAELAERVRRHAAESLPVPTSSIPRPAVVPHLPALAPPPAPSALQTSS